MKTMALLPVVCLCLLSCSGTTSADGNGVAPIINVKAIDQKGDKVLLRCEVEGASREHKVVWTDRHFNTIASEEPQVTERGGSYDIVLQATGFKSGFYYCAAKLGGHRQASAGIFGSSADDHWDGFKGQSESSFLIYKIGFEIIAAILVATTALAIHQYIKNKGPSVTTAL